MPFVMRRTAAALLAGALVSCGSRDAPRGPDSTTVAVDTPTVSAQPDSNCIACWLIPVGPEPLVLANQVYGAKLIQRGNRVELFLDSMVGEQADGRALWQQRTRVPLAMLEDSQTVTNECGARPDTQDGRTIGLVRPTGTDLYQVLRAWRIRPEQFAIDTLAVDSVACIVVGFGEND